MNKVNIINFYSACLAAVLISAAVFSGCGETLKPESVLADTGGGGGGGASSVVPGGGGQLTVAALNKEFNGGTDQHGMRICNITQAEVNKEEITTQGTLGLWEDNKFHIEGYNTAWNGTYANAGFTDVSILYYDRPFAEGEGFKFSARVRILRAGGVSTGKGLHFGAYGTMRDPSVDEDGAVLFGTGQNSKGVGMFLRCETSPQFRFYFSSSNSSTAAGTKAFGELTDLKYTKEYIYEVARVKLSNDKWYYTYKLFDSKTGGTVYDSLTTNKGWTGAFPAIYGSSMDVEAVTGPWGDPVGPHPALKGTVYPGICISGTAVEISQIKLWEKGDAKWDYSYKTDENGGVTDALGSPVTSDKYDEPVFRTPDTIPAYVPANFFTPVTVFKAKSSSYPDENVYVISGNNVLNWQGLVNVGYTIVINPKSNLDPNYAEDSIWFEFFTLKGDPRLSLEGVTPHRAEGGLSTAYETGRLVVDHANIASGETVEGRYKIVARDPWLDVPGPDGIDATDYSLKQTLPEYYFRILITKP